MATKSMLIDASHPEETRVVVIDGTRLEGYDVEAASRRQLKGNIYLAKVTRVEPSLQAAFVDYGGNRHGFLAFNEIHPDYYQIPVADRQALIEEHVQAEASEAEADAEVDVDVPEIESPEEGEPVEVLGGDDEEELERRRPRQVSRNYKIQEVIKRRQILLVQVVKEERGNKGAALTTYLSLAGRYCVLMPNTSRGGGISRKISSLTDRKRLKKILAELEVPEGMGVIVRTAGSGRTKAEIKRDYEYLMRLWGNIRETTLSSIAPALVYEEANLIKRSIRDLYGRDTEEIIIQGEPEYRVAKEFMKLFIPSHAKRVKLHDDSERPLFNLYQVESQLDAMHLPSVPLRSGGYIVINPTEALVSIDVNSGRATRERHIEETALRTNLEAADEVARQLRLRDLAGLIVIDFIDMENSRNQAQVERRTKDALKTDRARIQVGRISPFGLLELSRQRLRPSLLETSFEPCPHCGGMGVCRTTESTVLSILRKIEEEGLKAKGGSVSVTASPTVAMYLLNQKRKTLALMEGRFQLNIVIAADGSFAPAEHRLERVKGVAVSLEVVSPPAIEPAAETAEAVEVVEADEEEEEAAAPPAATGDEAAKRTRRRRPRRRRRSDDEGRPVAAADEVAGDVSEHPVAAEDADDGDEAGEGDHGEEEGELQGDLKAQDAARKRRRRGKRGGRRRPRRDQEGAELQAEVEAEAGGGSGGEAVAVAVAAEPASSASEPWSGDGDEAALYERADEGEPQPHHDDVPTAGSEPEPDGGDQAVTEAAADGDVEDVFPGEAEDASPGESEDASRHGAEGPPESEHVHEVSWEDDPRPFAPAAAGEVEVVVPTTVAEEGRSEHSFEIVSYPGDAESAWPGADAETPAADVRTDEESEPQLAQQPEPVVVTSGDGDGNGHGNGHGYRDGDEEPAHDGGETVLETRTAPAEPGSSREDEAEAARTEVIRVGGESALPGVPRKGWWQRLMS